MVRRALLALLAGSALLAGACDDPDFPEYNELEGFRLLAVQADPPALGPGETATLTTLIYDDGEPLDQVDYQWSWCPARLPTALGGDCVLDEEVLADELGLDDVSLDLGDAPTASFSHDIPVALLEGLCSAQPDAGAGSGLSAAFDVLLDCSQGLPITIQLIVSGRSGGPITAVKELRLLLEERDGDENPIINDLKLLEIPPDREFDDDTLNEDDAVSIAEDGTTEVHFGRRYRLFADVPPGASERFLKPPEGFDDEPMEKDENLALSWFVTSGDTDKERTAYTYGYEGSEISDVRQNSWRIPKPLDETRSEAQVMLVLRDERGGVTFLQRTVQLTMAPAMMEPAE
jgi:hypothetical protein